MPLQALERLGPEEPSPSLPSTPSARRTDNSAAAPTAAEDLAAGSLPRFVEAPTQRPSVAESAATAIAPETLPDSTPEAPAVSPAELDLASVRAAAEVSPSDASAQPGDREPDPGSPRVPAGKISPVARRGEQPEVASAVPDLTPAPKTQSSRAPASPSTEVPAPSRLAGEAPSEGSLQAAPAPLSRQAVGTPDVTALAGQAVPRLPGPAARGIRPNRSQLERLSPMETLPSPVPQAGGGTRQRARSSPIVPPTIAQALADPVEVPGRESSQGQVEASPWAEQGELRTGWRWRARFAAPGNDRHGHRVRAS